MMSRRLAHYCLIVMSGSLVSCSQPMGAGRVTQNQAFSDISGSILSTNDLSSETNFQLHRYALDQLIYVDPDQALRLLQAEAIATNDRDLLFALAETSYLMAYRQMARDRQHVNDRLQTRIVPPEREPQDYFLSAAIYAYFYILSPANNEPVVAFDRRFRTACDIYNFSLGWAITQQRCTNLEVQLAGSSRDLPAGSINVQFSIKEPDWGPKSFEKFMMADRFGVFGLSARNRQSGLGAPLIAIAPSDLSLLINRSDPATVFLRIRGNLADFAAGTAAGELELYSTYRDNVVTVEQRQIPLEVDFSVSLAYTMNQSSVWSAGRIIFLSAHKGLRNQLILPSTKRTGLIPVVLVHGTFSSPVWWAEMLNSLAADPVLRKRFQFWTYLYSSSNPILVSGAEFRDDLTAAVQNLDPQATDAAMRNMIIIGHSQGGLLTKLTVTDTGEKMWHSIIDRRIDEIGLNAAEEADIRRLFVLKPLPFVKRAVFISTPHRGSFQSGAFVRKIGGWFVSLPSRVIERTNKLLTLTNRLKNPDLPNGNAPTSLDGMSPNNPIMLALAEIPLAAGITGNSIVAVTDDHTDIRTGDDGVVTYASAHVDYVESELVVRQGHSCQDKPETIEEVRRIMHQHLAEFNRIKE